MHLLETCHKAQAAWMHTLLLTIAGNIALCLGRYGGKVKRVVGSTIANSGRGSQPVWSSRRDSIFIKRILAEMLLTHSVKIVGLCWLSWCRGWCFTKLVDDKRLRINISSLKKFIVNEEISLIRWSPGTLQLAIRMRKKGGHFAERCVGPGVKLLWWKW